MSKLRELGNLLKWKKSKSFYAKALNISELEVEKLLQELREGKPKPEITYDEGEAIIQDLKAGTLKSTKYANENPTTPEEIIKLHGIDPTKWKLSQFWSKQRKDKWLVSALFSAIKIEQDLPSQKEAILNEIKDYVKENSTPRAYGEPEATEISQDCLLEICLPDLHFGKLAHKEEVGEDYDIKIASARAKTAVNELLKRVNTRTVERILFPVGNDLFNVDNQQGTTTAGTPQNCDTRFHKMVKTVRKILIEIIDQLAEIAPVDIPVVVGNHDAVTAFMMGEILDAFYSNNSRVCVFNSSAQRKYYQYFDNGFQFTHGNGENHKDLGLIFATEQPRLWADTKFRFCQLGHFHNEKKTNYVSFDGHQGFQIQVLPSLSGPDAWHSGKGYISNKAAKAFMYHKSEGEVGSYTFTIAR